MSRALKPFTKPRLRKVIVEVAQSLYQIIDEAAIDVLLGLRTQARRPSRARGPSWTDFQRFIEENKDEIEALRILYGRPYRAGLRYRHVKELRDALRNPPVGIHDPANGLWRLYEALEPERVKGRGGSDACGSRGHREARDRAGRAARARGGSSRDAVPGMARGEGARRPVLHAQPTQVLDAIKDHIASSLRIERDDFEDVPFNQWGGLGGVYRVFGEDLDAVLGRAE